MNCKDCGNEFIAIDPAVKRCRSCRRMEIFGKQLKKITKMLSRLLGGNEPKLPEEQKPGTSGKAPA